MSSSVAILLRRTLLTVCPLQQRMISSKLTYEEAVHKLNTLQSNKATIDQIRKDIKLGKKCTNLEEMENYLMRTGVTLTMLDKLSVVHIAGTKGKGSTSAMCESILRHHGFRTGFYSSPHLIAVRERIRLDGQIITKEKFTEHFHQVYNLLDNSKAYDGDMPKYFAFLTVLAYNVFLKENVDVAIIEVGIGGVVDYTNVLRKVPVVGITALGLDHTSILGNSIEEIAEAKAGIMKPGCEAYTVHQPENAMNVLHRVASEVKCPLHVVPEYKTYLFPKETKSKLLPVELDAYCMNASLAIQLAHAWIRTGQHQTVNLKALLNKKYINDKRLTHNDIEEITEKFGYKNGYKLRQYDEDVIVTNIPMSTLAGLKNCRWPGRYQVIQSDYATFYLDGAHTKESMEICAKWYIQQNRTADKCLIFSATGDRDAEMLLKPLREINFQSVFFVIPTAFKEISQKNDNYTNLEHNELVSRCHKNAEAWRQLRKSDCKLTVLECISDALTEIKQHQTNSSVLITGSLYLVGASLSILDRNLSSMSQ